MLWDRGAGWGRTARLWSGPALAQKIFWFSFQFGEEALVASCYIKGHALTASGLSLHHVEQLGDCRVTLDKRNKYQSLTNINCFQYAYHKNKQTKKKHSPRTEVFWQQKEALHHQFLQSSLVHQFLQSNLVWSRLVGKTTCGRRARPASDNIRGGASPHETPMVPTLDCYNSSVPSVAMCSVSLLLWHNWLRYALTLSDKAMQLVCLQYN